jgi:hypothetical protein
MKGVIGVPSGSGIKDAAISGGVGAVGALIVMLSKRYFGTGLWGQLAGIIAAGSILKDGEGKIVSTVLGYNLANDLLAGRVGAAPAASAGQSQTQEFLI